MAKSKKDATSTRDDLATLLADSLNKEFTENKVAFFLDEEAPTNVEDWISTGSSILDLAISNRRDSGIPCGRITEITGLEASGKSLLAGHILAETQKKDGIAVYIDTESAVSKDFLQAMGVNINKLVYVQLETVEEIFAAIENIIGKVRTGNKDRLVTIVVDSVAAASTKVEMEADYDKDGWATTKAIIISKAMRKITNMIAREKIALVFTNQLRQKLGVSFGDQWTTSGGKALAFHSSVRLRLKAIGQIKKGEEIVGIKCKAQVVKNRMGPPLRQAEYDMYFLSGIDNYGAWLTVMKDHELVKQSGAWYTTNNQRSEEIKFQSKDWHNMLNTDNQFKEFIYNQIVEILVMKYESSSSLDIEDVSIEEGDVSED